MLATTSERFPKGGALLLGLMGTAGTLSIKFFLPVMGGVFDSAKIEAAGGAKSFAALEGNPEKMHEVLSLAAQESFRFVTALPLILILVFGCVWVWDRKHI